MVKSVRVLYVSVPDFLTVLRHLCERFRPDRPLFLTQFYHFSLTVSRSSTRAGEEDSNEPV